MKVRTRLCLQAIHRIDGKDCLGFSEYDVPSAIEPGFLRMKNLGT
jgi:hypothetical protein